MRIAAIEHKLAVRPPDQHRIALLVRDKRSSAVKMSLVVLVVERDGLINILARSQHLFAQVPGVVLLLRIRLPAKRTTAGNPVKAQNLARSLRPEPSCLRTQGRPHA